VGNQLIVPSLVKRLRKLCQTFNPDRDKQTEDHLKIKTKITSAGARFGKAISPIITKVALPNPICR
jgi:hypothetical protein